MSLIEVNDTLGIKSPCEELLTSNIAEGSAEVPAVFIDTPCCEYPFDVIVIQNMIRINNCNSFCLSFLFSILILFSLLIVKIS